MIDGSMREFSQVPPINQILGWLQETPNSGVAQSRANFVGQPDEQA